MDRWFAEFRASGDPRPLARVFDRAAPELWLVAAYLCRDRHTAEDAVQSTFLAAIEARADWDPTRPLLPWLLGILANRVHEERRRRTRRPAAERVAEPAGEQDPAAAAAFAELDGTLRRALAGIAEPYRATLEQHLVQGLSASEIATRGDVAAGTVRMRLHRGLEQLRRGLPKGLVPGGAGALLLTPESMAAMRSRVLAGADGAATAALATGMATTSAALAKPKAMTVAVAALVFGAGAVLLTMKPWADAAVGASASPPAAGVVAEAAAGEPPASGGTGPDAVGENVRELAGAGTAALRVTVVNGGNQAPVSGVEVIVTGDGQRGNGMRGTTDERGVAAFTVPPGPVEILALPSLEEANIKVAAGATVEHTLALPAFDVDVEVVDAAGNPVPGAHLFGRKSSNDPAPDRPIGATGRDGRWRASLLRAHVVHARAEGHASSDAVVLPGQQPITTLVLGAGPASVAGVVRGVDGQPIGDAGVAIQGRVDGARSADPACLVTRTDAEGRYACEGLAPGSYTIHAWHGAGDERRVWRAAAELTAWQRADVDVTFGRGARLVVEVLRPDGRPWPAWVVWVTISAREQPRCGIEVRAAGGPDEHGQAVFAGLPPGRHDVDITVQGDRSTEAIDLDDGQELLLRRTLGNADWAEVLLTDERGAPLPGYSVSPGDRVPLNLEYDVLFRDFSQTATTAADGLVRFDRLGGNPWVTVQRDDVVLLLAHAIRPNQRTTITLPAAQLAQGVVRGRIAPTDAGAAAPFEAKLVPVPATPAAPLVWPLPGPRVTTDAAGRFAFTAVPPGNYLLQVETEDPGYVALRAGITVTPGGETDLGTVVAGKSDLSCRLLRHDGSAVASPRLTCRLAPSFPFTGFPQTVAGDRVALTALPAGGVEVLALGADCAPTVARVATPHAGGELVVHCAPAPTVTVRFEDLPPESGSGTLRVIRGGRVWFEEALTDADAAWRLGLPAGSYRLEFRNERWVAEFTVGAEPLEVVARRSR